MYIIWIKIDETLPKIELKGEYQTRKEARKAAQQILSNIKIEIINASKKQDSMKPLATAKVMR
ncbi:MAG: hypothetical protein QHH17_03885 [Candidatus Bathyarchaeota archaeon]|nr:hypothetical protein [Candidatus Bathyarchaeota archaeon]